MIRGFSIRQPFAGAIMAKVKPVENRNWMLKLWRAAGDVKYFGDSIGNSAFDLLACTLGALITSLFI